MNSRKVLGAAVGLLGLMATSAFAQAPGQPVAGGARDFDQELEDALRAAKTAAGLVHLGTFNRLCILAPTNGPRAELGADAETPRVPRFRGNPDAPARETWYAEATQVFDDMYWLGGSQHSAWLLTSDEGHILIDTEYDYNSEELILDGMRKFGLDPMDIKYIIISHAHGDHIGGVELVQDATGDQAIVVMGENDWALVNNRPNANVGWTPNPDPNLRLSVPADTDTSITVGPHTVNIYSTPGHTPGTLSYTFTVHDWGRPVNVAYAGGTAFNFQTDVPDPGIPNLERYRATQERFAQIAADFGATVLISNHSEFDNAWTKARMMAGRGYGDPHPFEIGAEWVSRYFDVMVGCTSHKILLVEQAAAK
jgi:metallo-beta-lactamase class B